MSKEMSETEIQSFRFVLDFIANLEIDKKGNVKIARSKAMDYLKEIKHRYPDTFYNNKKGEENGRN